MQQFVVDLKVAWFNNNVWLRSIAHYLEFRKSELCLWVDKNTQRSKVGRLRICQLWKFEWNRREISPWKAWKAQNAKNNQRSSCSGLLHILALAFWVFNRQLKGKEGTVVLSQYYSTPNLSYILQACLLQLLYKSSNQWNWSFIQRKVWIVWRL